MKTPFEQGIVTKSKFDFCICISDDDEKEIMVCMFEFAKDLINLQLTETELALICAVVLIDHCEYESTVEADNVLGTLLSTRNVLQL